MKYLKGWGLFGDYPADWYFWKTIEFEAESDQLARQAAELPVRTMFGDDVAACFFGRLVPETDEPDPDDPDDEPAVRNVLPLICQDDDACICFLRYPSDYMKVLFEQFHQALDHKDWLAARQATVLLAKGPDDLHGTVAGDVAYWQARLLEEQTKPYSQQNCFKVVEAFERAVRLQPAGIRQFAQMRLWWWRWGYQHQEVVRDWMNRHPEFMRGVWNAYINRNVVVNENGVNLYTAEPFFPGRSI